MPVKKCDRKETRKNIVIRKELLTPVELRYLSMKKREKKKNMYPKLLGTEIAP
jgi:hypothetical protein